MSYLGQLPGMQWCATKRRYFPLRPGELAQSSCRHCGAPDCHPGGGVTVTSGRAASSSTNGSNSERVEVVASVGDVPAHPKILETLPKITEKNVVHMLRDMVKRETRSASRGSSVSHPESGKGGKRERDNGKHLDDIDCTCAICSQDMIILKNLVDGIRTCLPAKGKGESHGKSKDDDSGRLRKRQHKEILEEPKPQKGAAAESSSPEISENEETLLYLRPTCQHLFHKACLEKWLKSKGHCPLCRLPVDAALYAAHQSSIQGSR